MLARQLLEKAAASGGEEWLKRCLEETTGEAQQVAITEEVGMSVSTPRLARRQRREAVASAGGYQQCTRLQRSRPLERVNALGPGAVAADAVEESERSRAVEPLVWERLAQSTP